METKITKGKWIAGDLDVFAITYKEAGNLICFAPEHFPDSMKNWKANAKLIAAAPDLLEALIILFEHSYPNYKTIDNSIHPANIALKAIKKATE